MIYLFVALLVASLDMATKAMTLNFIDFGQHIDIIPGIVGLTATKNTGIAFSMFSDSGWILTAIIGVLVLILAIMMLSGKGFTGFERLCLALILGGAIGNLIDRLIYGYVLDMVEVLFVDFAVFNLADSCITVGCILFAIHLLFFHSKQGKAELAREEQRQRELEQMRRTMGDEEEAEKAAAREAAAKLTAAAEEAEKAARNASQSAIKPAEGENK